MQITTTISLLFLLSTTAAATTTFLRSSCQSTLYPTLCLQSISSYPSSSSHHTPRRLAFAALHVTLLRATSTSRYLSAAPATTFASGDCLQGMEDVVRRLKLSVRQMMHMGRVGNPKFGYRLSNMQTWVSGALTDVNACLEGFGEEDGGKARRKVEVVGMLVSNALALVNKIEI